jgi:hypothetical protein
VPAGVAVAKPGDRVFNDRGPRRVVSVREVEKVIGHGDGSTSEIELKRNVRDKFKYKNTQ